MFPNIHLSLIIVMFSQRRKKQVWCGQREMVRGTGLENKLAKLFFCLRKKENVVLRRWSSETPSHPSTINYGGQFTFNYST